ncbi:hypothetical protein D3C76_1003380 [compost metagenome]
MVVEQQAKQQKHQRATEEKPLRAVDAQADQGEEVPVAHRTGNDQSHAGGRLGEQYGDQRKKRAEEGPAVALANHWQQQQDADRVEPCAGILFGKDPLECAVADTTG